MTKKEFKEYERICKEAWKELSETGADEKPRRLKCFKHHCPACEISARASANNGPIEIDCKLCPVDLWREFAMESDEEWAACQVCQDFGSKISFFGDWLDRDVVKSKEAAKKISELKWSWLPEYKKVKSVLERYHEDVEAGL